MVARVRPPVARRGVQHSVSGSCAPSMESSIELGVSGVDLASSAFRAHRNPQTAGRRRSLQVDRIQLVSAGVVGADAIDGVERLQAVDPDYAVVDERDFPRCASLKRFALSGQGTGKRSTKGGRRLFNTLLDSGKKLVACDQDRSAPLLNVPE